MSRKTTLYTVAFVIAVAGFLPLAVMCIKSVMADGRVSFSYYGEIFVSGRAWVLLANSFKLAALTACLATIVGVPLGVLFGKTNLPGRWGFAALFTLPLLCPPYILAVSWLDALGKSAVRIQGLPGCVLSLFSAFLPIPMLLTVAAIRAVNPRLEEAARLASGWGGVLKGITLPLILPGVSLAWSLVFLLALGDLGVPMFLRYDVFPVESFTQFSAFLNFGAATASAMPLALVTVLILSAEWLVFHNRIQPLRPVAGDPSGVQIRLGRACMPLVLATAAACLLTVVIPLGGLVVQSSRFSAYAEAWRRAGVCLIRSVAYAGLGAVLLTVVGFLAGYLIHSRALPIWRAIDGFTLILFAMPGSVLGIGLVALWNHSITAWIYTTPAIILLGFVAQYVALTSRFAVSALSQIPPSMEEAAQMAGAGWWRRLTRILAPLAGRGLVAAWLVAFVFCLRDLSISTMVYPPGHDLFTTRTFTLMANGAPEMIAAMCVMLIAAALLPVGVLGAAFGKGGLLRALR